MTDPDARAEKYVEQIHSMEGKRWLRFPSDWLHQQVLMKSARQSGKSVEGPVVDDRHQAKDLAQVYKDAVRDTIHIDGRVFVCASGDTIIQSLFIHIYDKFRAYHHFSQEGNDDDDDDGGDGNDDGGDGGRVGGPEFDEAFSVERDHFITKNALAYTRAVLLASTRTVSGGDTYDAVDFMLRHEEISVVCPDSECVLLIFFPLSSFFFLFSSFFSLLFLLLLFSFSSLSTAKVCADVVVSFFSCFLFFVFCFATTTTTTTAIKQQVFLSHSHYNLLRRR